MSSLHFHIIMKNKTYLAVLLIMCLNLAFASEDCDTRKFEVPGKLLCECDILDNSKGWEYSCYPDRTWGFHKEFSLKNIIYSEKERTISLECRGNSTDYESLLQKIDHTNVQSYIFISCPLPNVSYGNLINSVQGTPLSEIKIENTKDERNFTAELFEPVSENLKSLRLINNGITNLPESIFVNLTKLQYLSLTDNRLKSLPEKIFQSLSQLTYLELANNLLESLSENIFDGLFQLKSLYMYKNKLKRLPHAVFKSLANLQVLDLSDNRLNNLSPDTFLGLSQLKNVRLRGNWLQSLPKELFSYTLNIDEINLSSNNFMEPLPETLIHNLTRLENLILESCNITYIHENFFGYSPKLRNLKLEDNKIIELPGNIFHNNSELKLINLNRNSIISLPADLLKNLKSLETLSLNDNNISVIPEGFFNYTINLKYLDLGQNHIKYISPSMFRDFSNLETIILSKNNLTNFTLPSDKTYHFKSIYLSHNNLTKFPSFPYLLNLQTLDLQYNKITHFEIPLVYSTQNPSINVAHNNIQTVDVRLVSVYDNGLSDLSSDLSDLSSKNKNEHDPTLVILHANPFICDCRLYPFYDYLKRNNVMPKKSVRFGRIRDLMCNEPSNYKGKSVLDMKADQFTCDITENCSAPCHCYSRIYDNSKIVNCSGHRLKQLPEQVPSNTNILHFEKNLLNSLQQLNNVRWDSLTEAYLDENKISTISDWKMSSNLKVLSLKHNRIRRLTEDFMNLTATKENFQVSLSDNPWTCNCSTKSFKPWLADNFLKVPDAFDVLCSQKIKQNDSAVQMSVMSIPDDAMCPPDDWPYRVQMITIATVCAVLALSLFIVSVLYYRNKQTVIAYLYIYMHPVFICFFGEEEFDEDKVFDAFVAYGHDDSDVAHKLIEELEPDFQLCIHERNWIAGNQISWNILNSVHSSRRTILVISKQFLESMWFQVEFHTAYYQMLEDKIDRLIIIVKGELPPKDTLDKELLFLLSTKTYLIWEERWFWEKLKYAMPHKKRELKSDALALKDKPDRDKLKYIDNHIAMLSASSNRATDKAQEVIQNGTNRAVSLVISDTQAKRL